MEPLGAPAWAGVSHYSVDSPRNLLAACFHSTFTQLRADFAAELRKLLISMHLDERPET